MKAIRWRWRKVGTVPDSYNYMGELSLESYDIYQVKIDFDNGMVYKFSDLRLVHMSKQDVMNLVVIAKDHLINQPTEQIRLNYI